MVGFPLTTGTVYELWLPPEWSLGVYHIKSGSLIHATMLMNDSRFLVLSSFEDLEPEAKRLLRNTSMSMGRNASKLDIYRVLSNTGIVGYVFLREVEFRLKEIL
jgi:hypothetical protein